MAKPHRKIPILKPQDAQRFWDKIDKTPGQGPNGDCWEWKACCSDKGYGSFMTGSRIDHSLAAIPAHRIAYYLQYGVDPQNKMVCHTCDNPPCCRGDHFFLGTNTDNQQDSSRKGRTARGDRSGPRLHPEKILRGEDAKNAKLTNAQVHQIKILIAKGVSNQAIAHRYKVHWMTVYDIKRGRCWKHL